MPLTDTEEKIMRDMKKRHGEKAGEREFYASANAGLFGPDSKERHRHKAKKERSSHRAEK